MSEKGVELDPRKTEAVKNWPKPLTPTNILKFFRLDGYYCRFVEGFCSIHFSLTALTKKKAKIEWTETCEKNFQELKDKLTSASVLTFPKCGENTLCIMIHIGLVWVVFLCRVVRLYLMCLDYSRFMKRIITFMT